MSDICCCICVRTKTVAVVESLGQYKNLLDAGFHCIPFPIYSVAGRLSLRVQQLDIKCETKTKDNVFVNVQVSVQFRVIEEEAYNAYYRLTDPRSQINSYVFDVVRSTVPRLELDETFASKADIATEVQQKLSNVMRQYGYEIMEALVTDLSPDDRVKASMNDINASKRLREAAEHKAEADKIKQVKAAEAHAEAVYLSGLGVARQRQAIVAGLQDSVSGFRDQIKGTDAKDVMDLLLLTQYFDTLNTVGANSMILEHEPISVAMLQKQVSKAFLDKKGGFF